jgi:hypothetical protein
LVLIKNIFDGNFHNRCIFFFWKLWEIYNKLYNTKTELAALPKRQRKKSFMRQRSTLDLFTQQSAHSTWKITEIPKILFVKYIYFFAHNFFKKLCIPVPGTGKVTASNIEQKADWQWSLSQILTISNSFSTTPLVWYHTNPYIGHSTSIALKEGRKEGRYSEDGECKLSIVRKRRRRRDINCYTYSIF